MRLYSTDDASSGDWIARVGAVITLARHTGAEVRTFLGPVIAFSTALARAADVVRWTLTLFYAVCDLTATTCISHVQLHVR